MSMKAGAGMIYEGMLSLKFASVPALPSPNQLVAINEGNEVLLNNLLMLDEKFENDDHDEVMQELRRQDMKIRMIMDLLGTLLLQNQLLPPVQLVRFTGEELSVPAAGLSLTAGDKVQCSLFIDAALPKPLVLFAEVLGQHVEEGTQVVPRDWLDFTFIGLNRPVRDNIEKFIFRHHRKAVALQRRQTSTPS